MPQNSNLRLTRNHRFFAINGIYSHATKTWWGHPRIHLGANGVLLGAKNGSKMYKITMFQNSNFRLPRGHRFIQKMEVTVMAPNHGGEPLGSILGIMGSHWVQNMGQNRKKLPCRKIPNIWLPRGHRFFAKTGSYGYGAKSRWGPPSVHLGANGVPLGKKNCSKP